MEECGSIDTSIHPFATNALISKHNKNIFESFCMPIAHNFVESIAHATLQ
jgi:hypothetical protein